VEGARAFITLKASGAPKPSNFPEVSGMNFFKIILAIAVTILAVLGAFALFGLLVWLVKYLLIFAVVALVGVGAYKLLSKSDDGSLRELSSAEREMQSAERMLAELRRKQLTK
jgi:hypothetical protein